MYETVSLGLRLITANIIMVTIEEKQVNIFKRFCFIFGRAYLPEHSRQIETCLPEKFTSGRDRETHQGEVEKHTRGRDRETHKGRAEKSTGKL